MFHSTSALELQIICANFCFFFFGGGGGGEEVAESEQISLTIVQRNGVNLIILC